MKKNNIKSNVSPLISCIITTYKRPTTILDRAIKSVIRQTYKNIELIVVNDCPEDKNLSKQIMNLINSYKKNNIKYICLEKNSGACYARNKGAEIAKGEFFAFLDDDDEWLPEKLEKQQKKFTNNNIGLVYCDNFIIYKNRKRIHKQLNPSKYGNDYKQILDSNFIGGVSFPLIRSKCFNEVGGFDSDLPSSQDTDLWIRILKKYDIAYCAEPLLNYYISDISITNNLTKKVDGYNRILEKYKTDYDKYPDVLANSCLKIGNVFIIFGDYKTANIYYKKAKELGIGSLQIAKNKFISNLRFIKRNLFSL